MSSRAPMLALALCLAILACSNVPAQDLPLGLARLNPVENPTPAAEITLGKKLFFDKLLSSDGTVSCANCHVPAEAFAQRGQARSKGVGGKFGRRNSPSLLNVTFAKHLFLDGRSSSLEDQAWQPILDDDEMNNPSVESVLDRLANSELYPALFMSAFASTRPNKETVARALSSFQRTLLSGNSPFDQWYWGGEKEAISPLAIEGFNLFSGQALCWQCHSVGGDHGILFTDQQFHNTGVEWLSEQQRKEIPIADGQEEKKDQGRFEATGKRQDRRQYKTPSLRNIALTPPYMHDGSFETLEDVVEFYNRGGGDSATQSLYLKPDDLKAIVAFLECLSGDQDFEAPPEN